LKGGICVFAKEINDGLPK